MAADIMTIDEVAYYLRINRKTAYRLAADSKLPGFKVGGTWRFRRVDIEDCELLPDPWTAFRLI